MTEVLRTAVLKGDVRMEIRLATEEDAVGLHAIFAGVPAGERFCLMGRKSRIPPRDTVRKWIEEADAMLVGVVGGEIVGYFEYWAASESLDGDCVELATLVAPQWRRRGVATALIGMARAHALAAGVTDVRVATHVTNRRVQRWAAALGLGPGVLDGNWYEYEASLA
jgi:GNAT superfamily N-acetyltransferase